MQAFHVLQDTRLCSLWYLSCTCFSFGVWMLFAPMKMEFLSWEQVSCKFSRASWFWSKDYYCRSFSFWYFASLIPILIIKTCTEKIRIVNQINLLVSNQSIQASFSSELQVLFQGISNTIWHNLHMRNLLGDWFSGNLLCTVFFPSLNMKGFQTMEITLPWNRSEMWPTAYTHSTVSFYTFPLISKI